MIDAYNVINWSSDVVCLIRYCVLFLSFPLSSTAFLVLAGEKWFEYDPIRRMFLQMQYEYVPFI